MLEQEQQEQGYKKWLADGGRSRIVTFGFLDKNSVVFEVGYWLGEWVQQMLDLYRPILYVFEPIKEWYDAGASKFKHDSNVHMFNFGLGDSDKELYFGLDRDSTGMFCPNRIHQVRIKSIVKFLHDNKIENIDLFQSNCEGGEYEIFPALIESQEIKKLRYIIIQFHNLREEHPEQRKRIQDGLSKTHKLLFCYDWRFEYWERI